VPDVDLNVEWLDEGLYQHFELSQEQIDRIEKQIKTIE